MLEMRTLALAQLGRGFALAPGLRGLIVSSTTRLRQDTRLLDFALKLLQRRLKGEVRIDDGLGHGAYQRARLRCADRLCEGW